MIKMILNFLFLKNPQLSVHSTQYIKLCFSYFVILGPSHSLFSGMLLSLFLIICLSVELKIDIV